MTAPTIVSLVPSLSELVWWFGLGERLVGRTRFCIEPAGEVERVPIIGGTKNPHVDRIVALLHLSKDRLCLRAGFLWR